MTTDIICNFKVQANGLHLLLTMPIYSWVYGKTNTRSTACLPIKSDLQKAQYPDDIFMGFTSSKEELKVSSYYINSTHSTVNLIIEYTYEKNIICLAFW